MQEQQPSIDTIAIYEFVGNPLSTIIPFFKQHDPLMYIHRDEQYVSIHSEKFELKVFGKNMGIIKEKPDTKFTSSYADWCTKDLWGFRFDDFEVNEDFKIEISNKTKSYFFNNLSNFFSDVGTAKDVTWQNNNLKQYLYQISPEQVKPIILKYCNLPEPQYKLKNPLDKNNPIFEKFISVYNT